jgi:4-azaleucine resistance transporter AzlC
LLFERYKVYKIKLDFNIMYKKNKTHFLEVFKESIPIMVGYVPTGIACGLLFSSFNFKWFIAPLLAMFMASGAAQFLSVNLLSNKINLLELGIITFFVNIRHSFYGLSFLKRYKGAGIKKIFLIHTLTDEIYSYLTTKKNKDNNFCLLFGIVSLSYWVIGCLIGSIVGNLININSKGMEFSLVILFIILAIEQYKNMKIKFPFILGFSIAILYLIIFGKENMLFLTILISLLILIIFNKRIKK